MGILQDKTGINDCLNRAETDYQTELETLMKPNFQNLKNEHLLALEGIDEMVNA